VAWCGGGDGEGGGGAWSRPCDDLGRGVPGQSETRGWKWSPGQYAASRDGECADRREKMRKKVACERKWLVGRVGRRLKPRCKNSGSQCA
jgi:hypothetical protein